MIHLLLSHITSRFIAADCPDEWATRVAHTDSVVRRAKEALALGDAKIQQVAASYRVIDERLHRR